MQSVKFENFQQLFACPLAAFRIAEAEALNRSAIADIKALRSLCAGVQKSNQNGWHSNLDFFQRGEASFVRLGSFISDAIRQATRQISPGFAFDACSIQAEGWINVNGRGAYNSPHDHPGWAWSGSYYVACPSSRQNRGGMIEFLDPRTGVRAVTVDGANCFAGKVAISPEPGMIILFPSFLRHWVYPNEQDADRISITFNARFVAARTPTIPTPA
jgi:uncharacterized protein (TIGR02466 family)